MTNLSKLSNLKGLMFATFPRYPVTGQFVIFEFHTWYMSHMIHLVHGAGIFTYMNGWFLWDQCRWIFQAPWILWLLWMLCVMKSLWNILTWSLTVRPPKGKTNASQPSFVQGFLLLGLLGGIVLFRLLNVSGDRQGCTPIPTWAPYGKSLYHVGIYGL